MEKAKGQKPRSTWLVFLDKVLSAKTTPRGPRGWMQIHLVCVGFKGKGRQGLGC